MPKEFRLPDPGEGIHEADIVDVLVSEGDSVEDGQSILVIETDKATTEVPSPYTGTVREIRVKKGDVVTVGDVLMVFDVEGEAEEEEEAPPAKPKKKQPEEKEARAEEEEEGKESGDEERKKEEPPVEEEEEGRAPPPERPAAARGKRDEDAEEGPEPEKRQKGPIPAAPSTRRLARELGVELREVPASGPGGRVTSEDVRAFAEGEAPAGRTEEGPEKGREERPQKERAPEMPSLPDFEKWGPVEREPLRSIRRAIARRMVYSWTHIPHVTHEDVADITELEEFRHKHKPDIERQGGQLTLSVFALKAAVAALRAHPRFNASLDSEADEIVLKHYYHLGVATDTERGLIVPVVRDVDRKSIVELAQELPALAERVRGGEVDREELSGGSFTITNVGPLGGVGFTPIINFPQVAILGLGRARLQPVVQGTVEQYEIVPRLMLPLALGFDHRVVDGADAARFMNAIIEVLEDPEQLMMEM